MKTSVIAVFSLVLCLFFFSTLFAHDGKAHETDMLAVFGISAQDKALAKRLHPTLEVFCKHIDHDLYDFYRGLRLIMLPHDFSWGDYGHRIFFHWGFNTDPRKSESLQRQFDLTTSDPKVKERGFQYIIYVGSRTNSSWNSQLKKNNDSAPEHLELKFPASVKGQAARNRDMIQAVGRLSPAQRKHHNAVATVIYNTHILGDYIEGKVHTQAAMQPLKAVISDTIKHGVMNFDCSYQLRNDFKKEMWEAYYSSGAVKNKAEAVLKVMTIHIPKCVDKSKVIKRIVWGDIKPAGIISLETTPKNKK